MEAHHEAWLTAHSHRTEDWLKEQLKDGFDVHHIDGDHSNNDPLNLVLMEASDHMMLHNTKKHMIRGSAGVVKAQRQKKIDSLGKQCFDLISEGETWSDIAHDLKISKATGLKWLTAYCEKYEVEMPKEMVMLPVDRYCQGVRWRAKSRPRRGNILSAI